MNKLNHILFLSLSIILSYSCEKDVRYGIDCKTNEQVKYSKAVLLVLGQSNAANFGETKFFSDCNNLKVFYDGEFYPLQDPVKGANGDGGSIWSRMGEQLFEQAFANEIIIAPAAVGGSVIEAWIPGNSLNNLIVGQIESLQNEDLNITHILWHQGESNNSMFNGNNPATNAVSYKTNFLLLENQIRSLGVAAPIFIATATRCGYLQQDTFLQNAQQQLANENNGIFLGPNTDLLGNDYRYDNCHFSDKGLEVHADLWTQILLQH